MRISVWLRMETFYYIENIRSSNGYQWSGEKITPIPSIDPQGNTYLNEEVIELTGMAFEDYYNCFQPFYDLLTKLKKEKRTPFPFIYEEKLEPVKVHQLIQKDEETLKQIKNNLLVFLNQTGTDYIILHDCEIYQPEELTLGHLIHNFVDLHNAISEKEPFIPPSKWVQKRINHYGGYELVYRTNKYVPKFSNIFGAIWHTLVQKEWGFKPSNCQWCNTFLITNRRGAVYCGEPRTCRFKASNYKISQKKREERKKNANKKA